MTSTPVSLSSPAYDEIGNKIRKSYPNACVCWLEEIKNPSHEELFQKTKADITAKRKKEPETLQLFHGTTEPAVNSILRDGFDPAYSKVAAYGKGTYFALNASYSRTYAKPAYSERPEYDDISYMFLADVLVGTKTCTPSDGITDITKYDISVDSQTSPTIFSTPYRWGAIPRYIVAFYQGT